MNKDLFRKKLLLPVTYILVVGIAVLGANQLVSEVKDNATTYPAIAAIEPAAGDEAAAAPVPPVSEAELKDAPVVNELPAAEAPEEAPLRISPDKPEVLHLNGDVVSVLVGSEDTLRAVPDTNRSIILIPKKPGATYFKALDGDGKVIAQRHVIIGAPVNKSKYIRIRRACVNGAEGCREYSVYYCPDMCHEVNVVQDEKKLINKETPNDVASSPSPETEDNPNSENETVVNPQ